MYSSGVPGEGGVCAFDTDDKQAVFALFIDIAACVAVYFGRYGWWRLWICTMVSGS